MGVPVIESTLEARGKQYGDFPTQSTVAQNIKRAMRHSPNWHDLTDDKKECLEMLAMKISRILNGNPEYHDSWHDIVGYATLVANTLTEEGN